MNKYIPLIFIGLTIGGFALLAYHLTNETSTWKDYLSSSLIIIANIGMFIAIKKSDQWTKKDDE
ncbi:MULTISPECIES: hypothetical protein [Dokdonia]|jgi:hypothetical protein|uniref:Uncharacterized protein n=2 Tax=Dokdonia TaxID=326319 RepID=A0A0A2GVD1_9FLAO|nr:MULTISPECIES: hypothetical protein [Dokdonia]ANH59048.1 hypothetical protein I597_0113 [Dokdonia donghaensis DSW-1]AWH74271.1 hypothetical protein DCS32_08875 [Dokdonia sp. Dokd-P16]EAQ39106.1 hypothetical protein MED134_00765 [Dokdonia sp. MED134]KGO06478.1 hypothetical protein NV36_06260 [Dokdonia donghaensis DSW-1]|tara:strand:+ start:10540 stop:10731 length:192 start_codon:yes stop_codon:yes gene_type:complete